MCFEPHGWQLPGPCRYADGAKKMSPTAWITHAIDTSRGEVIGLLEKGLGCTLA
jgi:hypothetical protein